MFRLQKAIERYLDEQIKELRTKDKKDLKLHELELILSIEEEERKHRK